MAETYTLTSPMPGHTPALDAVVRTSPIPGHSPKTTGGTKLTCECGWLWYTPVAQVDGSYALANTAYQGHTLAVQAG